MNKFSNRFNKEEQQTVITDKPENTDNKFEEDLKKSLLEKIDGIPVWFEYPEIKQKELIRNFVNIKIAIEKYQINEQDKENLIEKLTNASTNFGPIQELLDNEKVESVLINGTKSIHIEINGKILNTETNLNDKQLRFLLNSISYLSNRKFTNEINQFSINNYSLTIVGTDLCLSGINITIKKQTKSDPECLIKKGMMSKEVFDFLINAVNMKKNIVISGGINSGKTTLLNAILLNSLKGKRVYVIENYPQLTAESDTMSKFKNENNIISYIVKSAPDYIVSDLNYIEPEFTDVKGFISTVRANSEDAALQALIGMCVVGGLPAKFAKNKALKNFDYIVQLEKTEDCVCRIASIVELTPAKTNQASVKTLVKYDNGHYNFAYTNEKFSDI